METINVPNATAEFYPQEFATESEAREVERMTARATTFVIWVAHDMAGEIGEFLDGHYRVGYFPELEV